jgi:hypothetical protein
LSPDTDLYIYDYSSFTSRLVDNRAFIERLAWYCYDTNVFILDTHYGPLEYNLGSLIQQYNQDINFECPFDVTKILALEEPTILHMASSGPLGVPGNIVSSTTTHGIIQAEITGSVDRGNSIGDDAISLRDAGGLISRAETLDLHRSIGSIEESKACWWTRNSTTGGGWHYVKRPLDRQEEYIVQGWMPDFPNYPVLLGVKDDDHTVPPVDFESRRVLCAKQVGRFFDRCLRSSFQPSQNDLDFTLTVFRHLYHMLNLDDRGTWPNASVSRKSRGKALKFHFVPPLLEECFSSSWLLLLLNRRTEDAIVLLPKEDEGDIALPETLSPGESFEYRGNKVLGTLELLGLLEKSRVYEDVLVTEADYDRIVRLVLGNSRSVYRFTCVDTIHYWDALLLFLRSDTDLAGFPFR